MKKIHIKVIVVLLAVIMLFSMTPPNVLVQATSTKEKLAQAEREKREAQKALEETEDVLDDIKGQRNTLQSQMDGLTKDLEEVSQNIATLETEIIDKETQITTTREELEVAKADEELQYESMKNRIQFMYERSQNAYLEILFSANSIADLINQTEYISKLEQYDRKMLIEYEDTRALIELKEETLVLEYEKLEQLKAKAEEEKQRVAVIIANTANYISIYQDQISDVEKQILDKEEEIKRQDADIVALKKKIAEEQALSELAAKSKKRDISEVIFEEGDRYLLANIIYCEAGGESYAGQLAVGSVIMNRVLSAVFPNTVVGVVYQRRQFSPVGSGRLALALAQNKATENCYRAADEAMSGVTNVEGCLFFRTPVDGIVPKYVIGGHIFY